MRERGERPDEGAAPAAGNGAAPAAAPLPIDWWRCDAAERVETLGVLSEWVPELVLRYGLTERVVPACWWRHEALIQELLALFQFRNQQQFNLAMGPPPSAALDFHSQLQFAITRMRGWVSEAGCTSQEHFPQLRPSWADPDTAAHARWSVEVIDEVSRVWGEDEESE